MAQGNTIFNEDDCLLASQELSACKMAEANDERNKMLEEIANFNVEGEENQEALKFGTDDKGHEERQSPQVQRTLGDEYVGIEEWKKKLPSSVKAALERDQEMDFCKVPQCEEGEDCIFCTYHVEGYMVKPHDGDPIDTRLCRIKGVLFLLYCIHCDMVWIGYINREFQYLVDIHFGFEGDAECLADGKHHCKRYLRCILLKRPTKDALKNKICEEMSSRLIVPKLDLWPAMNTLRLKTLIDYNYSGTNITFRAQGQEYSVAGHLTPQTESIIYLITCKRCHLLYVGKTLGHFGFRYPAFVNKQDPTEKKLTTRRFTTHVMEHSVRDLRWKVIDGLTVEQTDTINRWNDAFNKTDFETKKAISMIFDRNDDKVKSKLLLAIDQSNNINVEVINDILKEIAHTSMQLEEHVKGRDEEYFKKDNKNWIQERKESFLLEREDYWIKELRVLDNSVGLNMVNSPRKSNIGHKRPYAAQFVKKAL